MKYTVFIVFSVLIAGISFTQGKRVETKTHTQNGQTTGWTIVTEYDVDGSVINVDSTFFEQDATANNGHHFEFKFEGPAGSNVEFYRYGSDSTFQNMIYSFGHDSLFLDPFGSHNLQIEDYLNEYRELLKNHMLNPNDPIPPPGNDVIVPDQSKIKKI